MSFFFFFWDLAVRGCHISWIPRMNKMYSLGKLSQHKVTYCQKSKLIAEKYFWVTINMHDETCKAQVSNNLLTTLRNSLWNISLNPLLSFPLTPSEANVGLPPKNEDIFAKWTTSVVLCHYVYKWFIKMIYIHVRYVASIHVCSWITYNQKLCCSSASFFSMWWSEMQEDTKDLRTIS